MMLSRTIPRRILMTVDAVGGVWRYAVDLSANLSRQGIEVVLLGFGPKPGPEQAADVRPFERVKMRWTDLPLDWMIADDQDLPDVGSTIETIADEERIDLLHLNYASHVPLRSTRGTVAVAHSCLTTWFGALHPGEPLPDRWRRHHAHTRAGFARADLVLAPSASHAASLRNAYQELGPLQVVHNGSSAKFADGQEKSMFVAAAGRWWDRAKNVETLDAAAADCEWPIRIAGPLRAPDGNEFPVSNLCPVGVLDRERMADLLTQAGIFVSTARYEPFGLAVLEAALANCALVLSDIPTFRELWEGAALFSAPDDPKGFANAINLLASDPDERRALAAAAAKRAGQFSVDVQTEKIMRAYAEVFARRSIPAEVC